jgi:hypothetical protein
VNAAGNELFKESASGLTKLKRERNFFNFCLINAGKF